MYPLIYVLCLGENRLNVRWDTFWGRPSCSFVVLLFDTGAVGELNA